MALPIQTPWELPGEVGPQPALGRSRDGQLSDSEDSCCPLSPSLLKAMGKHCTFRAKDLGLSLGSFRAIAGFMMLGKSVSEFHNL